MDALTIVSALTCAVVLFARTLSSQGNRQLSKGFSSLFSLFSSSLHHSKLVVSWSAHVQNNFIAPIFSFFFLCCCCCCCCYCCLFDCFRHPPPPLLPLASMTDIFLTTAGLCSSLYSGGGGGFSAYFLTFKTRNKYIKNQGTQLH